MNRNNNRKSTNCPQQFDFPATTHHKKGGNMPKHMNLENVTKPTTPKKFYRVKTLAEICDCSKGTIWGLIKVGTLTRIKLSEQITVIDAAEADAWIESRRGQNLKAA
jgi:predicted DNA-binding transcriptional regulator AlpA